MTSPHPRPRVIEAAFWCWMAAAVLLFLFGILTSAVYIPLAYRGAGALLAGAGAGLGYLAIRTRRGDKRFRRATMVLTIVLAVLVGLFAVLTLGPVWALIVALLVPAAICATRQAADDWFDAVDESLGDESLGDAGG
jgi:hypothetical protein